MMREFKFGMYAALATIAMTVVAGSFLWAMLFPEEGFRALFIGGMSLIVGALSNVMVEKLK